MSIYTSFRGGVILSLNAQESNLQSHIQPAKSNGYIYWDKGQSANTYLVKIYQNMNNSLTLLQTDTTSKNYFHFNTPQLLASDLFYTITAMDVNNVIVGTSDPVEIDPNSPPPSPLCWIDCNGKKEAYRLYQMQTSNRQPYLMASDDAGADPNTGLITPYFQAIDQVSYDLLNQNHPYAKETGYNYVTNKPIFLRQHIKIDQNTPGIPFMDAANTPVVNGWLVEKRMDKFAHFNGANTGMYEGMDSWCLATIQNATVNFNQHVVSSTQMPVSTEQTSWFLDQIGTNPNGSPIYYIPTGMECVQTTYNGTPTPDPSPNPLYGYALMVENCFNHTVGGTTDPMDCVIDSLLLPNGSFISGFTFESVDAAVGYFASVENNNGVGKIKYKTGEFVPGLYRVVAFMDSGRVAPTYLELGNVVDYKDIHIDIYPNVIVGRTLKFNLRTDTDVEVDIMVQKLDGTTVYTETANLIGGNTVQRIINVTGDIPYNQLRVSVVLPNGTLIQSTALVN